MPTGHRHFRRRSSAQRSAGDVTPRGGETLQQGVRLATSGRDRFAEAPPLLSSGRRTRTGQGGSAGRVPRQSVLSPPRRTGARHRADTARLARRGRGSRGAPTRTGIGGAGHNGSSEAGDLGQYREASERSVCLSRPGGRSFVPLRQKGTRPRSRRPDVERHGRDLLQFVEGVSPRKYVGTSQRALDRPANGAGSRGTLSQSTRRSPRKCWCHPRNWASRCSTVYSSGSSFRRESQTPPRSPPSSRLGGLRRSGKSLI